MNHTEIRVVTARRLFSCRKPRRLTDFSRRNSFHAVWVCGERAIAAARLAHLPEAPFERAGAKHLQFTGHYGDAMLPNWRTPATTIVEGGDRRRRRCSIPPKRSPSSGAAVCRYPDHRGDLRRTDLAFRLVYWRGTQALQFEGLMMPIFTGAGRARIILQAPDDYLLAGIGDTLAKW